MIRRVLVIKNPRYARAIADITDRAKRYRAQHPDVRPNGPRVCGFCRSRRNVVIHHKDGNEANLRPSNLMWACKSCNTELGLEFARKGRGVLTDQYNPRGRGGRGATKRELDHYGALIKVMRGEFPGDQAAAHAEILATPAYVRSAYTAKSWPSRRAIYGPSGRQMSLDYDVPF